MLIAIQNKQIEATEQRKLNAKRIEMQRREAAKAGRASTQIPRQPAYPTYTPPVQTTTVDPMDSYAAEKNRTNVKPAASSGKGMQLGKKSRKNDIFEQVRGDLPDEPEAPLVAPTPQAQPAAQARAASSRPSLAADREPVHVTISETINARLTRDGTLSSFDVSGNLQLKISDASLTQIRLDLSTTPDDPAKPVQWFTHPKVDKQTFLNKKLIQLRDTSRGFPKDTDLQVLRWRHTSKPDAPDADIPLTLTAWVNKTSDNAYNVTVEYELTGADTLRDVSVTIPYSPGSEPSVSSFDSIYAVSGDSLEWNIGAIDLAENPNGSFEFEAAVDEAADEEGEGNAFFPMSVRFAKARPFVGVEVGSVVLVGEGEGVPFSKDMRCVAEKYEVA